MFSSVEQALYWAFETTQTPLMKISQYQENTGRGQQSLSANERHMQAWHIIMRLMELPAREYLVLAGLYAGYGRPEVCAKELKSFVCRDLPIEAGLATALIGLYFRDGMSLRQCARQCGVSYGVAYRRKQAVFDLLDIWRQNGIDTMANYIGDLLKDSSTMSSFEQKCA